MSSTTALSRVRVGSVSAGALVAGVGVLMQICWPLTTGGVRSGLTVAIVLVIALASLVHAQRTRGTATALTLFAVTAGVGLTAELLGVHTGVPFGSYHYTGGLGPSVAGVPLVIGPAWTMTAWPAAAAARRLTDRPLVRVLIGAWALTAWDLALDPQMVAEGHWRWLETSPHLPGVPTIPLTNWIGWFAVSVVISALLLPLLDRRDGVDGVPVALYLWTAVSSVLLLAVFVPQPAAAAWTAVAMGSVAVPLAVRLWRSR